MTFKEQIAADVKVVFINLLEFADKHLVNGVLMDVIVDENELLERDKARLGINQDGLYNSRKLMYVPAEQYGAKPVAGSFLYLDKRKYMVVNCTDEEGVYSIELKAVRS